MNGVTVKKIDGSSENISVIRYFKLNDFSYLIFSLNEIDDGGYVKLYISKISNGMGVTISDDVEWNLVKDTIKDIIKRIIKEKKINENCFENLWNGLCSV